MATVRQNLRNFAAAALVLALSGCATVEIGKDFDPQDFDTWVKRGETTQAQVQERYGPPVSTGAVIEHDGSKYQRWLYYHAKSKINKLGEAKLKLLEIRFNAQQKVDNYNWSAE